MCTNTESSKKYLNYVKIVYVFNVPPHSSVCDFFLFYLRYILVISVIIFIYILFYIFTCGLYKLYFSVRLIIDLKSKNSDEDIKFSNTVIEVSIQCPHSQ